METVTGVPCEEKLYGDSFGNICCHCHHKYHDDELDIHPEQVTPILQVSKHSLCNNCIQMFTTDDFLTNPLDGPVPRCPLCSRVLFGKVVCDNVTYVWNNVTEWWEQT